MRVRGRPETFHLSIVASFLCKSLLLPLPLVFFTFSSLAETSSCALLRFRDSSYGCVRFCCPLASAADGGIICKLHACRFVTFCLARRAERIGTVDFAVLSPNLLWVWTLDDDDLCLLLVV